MNIRGEDFRVTNSQKELIKALAKGFKLRETSKIMNINYNNLQKRVQLIYKKFGVHSRQDLIYKAISQKIITTKDVTNRYRNKYIKIKQTPKTDLLLKYIKYCSGEYKLNKLELNYLIAKLNGKSVREILEILPIYGKYHAKCIEYNIVHKLEVDSIFEAIIFLTNFEII